MSPKITVRPNTMHDAFFKLRELFYSLRSDEASLDITDDSILLYWKKDKLHITVDINDSGRGEEYISCITVNAYGENGQPNKVVRFAIGRDTTRSFNIEVLGNALSCLVDVCQVVVKKHPDVLQRYEDLFDIAQLVDGVQ